VLPDRPNPVGSGDAADLTRRGALVLGHIIPKLAEETDQTRLCSPALQVVCQSGGRHPTEANLIKFYPSANRNAPSGPAFLLM